MVDNTFRKAQRQLDPLEKFTIGQVKEVAALLLVQFESAEILRHQMGGGGSREIAIAKTKLEEAVMWAVKGITA